MLKGKPVSAKKKFPIVTPGADRLDGKRNEEEVIQGVHAVAAALENKRPIHRLLLQTGLRGEFPERIRRLGREFGIPVQEVEKKVLETMGGKGHQGVVAVVAAATYASVDQILALAREKGEPPLLLVLDEVQDPRNLGAMARTAEAAGVHGIIIGKNRSAGMTGAAAKAGAGALEYLLVARVTNIARTLTELKEKGIWVGGLEADGEKLHWMADLKGPLALVLGGEGKGLGRLIRENCDFTVRLPMLGKISSLNIAAAGAVVLYEVLRQRQERNGN